MRAVELLPSSTADWPLSASRLRSLDVCSSQISDVTHPHFCNTSFHPPPTSYVSMSVSVSFAFSRLSLGFVF